MANSPFGFAKPEDSPGFLLWQTTITWQRQIRNALEPYNISHTQFVIMAVILWFGHQGQAPIQSAIIARTKLDKMTVSKALKALVQKKLVQRTEHVEDTRAKQVALTDQGKALIQQLVPVVERVDEQYFEAISNEDRSVLISLLTRIVDHIASE